MIMCTFTIWKALVLGILCVRGRQKNEALHGTDQLLSFLNSVLKLLNRWWFLVGLEFPEMRALYSTLGCIFSCIISCLIIQWGNKYKLNRETFSSILPVLTLHSLSQTVCNTVRLSLFQFVHKISDTCISFVLYSCRTQCESTFLSLKADI